MAKYKIPLLPKIKGYLYFFVVGIGAFILSPLYGFFFCHAFRDGIKFNGVASYFFHPIFKLFGIKLVVEGEENIPKGKGFVVIANHQSFLDINAVYAGVCPSAFIAKEELWKIPVFGWLLSRTGSIPIHRGASRTNTKIGALLKQRIDQGFSYTIFPEGKRSEDGVLLPFKNGIFHMAKEFHFDLVPVTIINAGKIFPKQGVALFPGELKVVIHKPVTQDEYGALSLETFRENVRNTIASALPQKTEAKEA